MSAETDQRSRLAGYALFEKLGKPKHVVAPMVDASELAWRLLSRRYGAQLCFTPMYNANCFVNSAAYRNSFTTCESDRPLIVQFCANDPEVFSQACGFVVGRCDAVDLNLGCPQAIARAGHFGAFLQDEWQLITAIISRARHDHPEVPITAKIRVFEDVQKTVAYAKTLVAAGVSMLTVHGRTREQKGRVTGTASWDHIKAVKANVPVPVIANGNIQYFEDIERCLKETGVDAVMTAEGNLHNPALFSGSNPLIWQIADEYLDLAMKYPCPLSYARGHLFKILHHAIHMEENHDVRDLLGNASSLEDFAKVTNDLKARLQSTPDFRELTLWETQCGLKPLAVFRCQPYVRRNPDDVDGEAEKRRDPEESLSHLIDHVQKLQRPLDVDLKTLSKNKLKKLKRYPRRCFTILSERTEFPVCKSKGCRNPKGSKCGFAMCKACCRANARLERLTCEAHRAFFEKLPNELVENTLLDRV